MKLVIDEKVKHRLVGLAVILSMGIIIAPAVLKKSQQHKNNKKNEFFKTTKKRLFNSISM